jgi:hypothetical protein
MIQSLPWRGHAAAGRKEPCMPRAAVSFFLIALVMAGRPAAAMSTPCSWLTPAEVSAALGIAVSDAEEKRSMLTGKPSGCLYKTADVMRFVVLDAYERPSEAEARRTFAQLTERAAQLPGGNKSDIKPVPGLGDEAANVSNVLFLRKGAIVLALTVFAGGNAQTTTPEGFEKAKTLIRGAWGRI